MEEVDSPECVETKFCFSCKFIFVSLKLSNYGFLNMLHFGRLLLRNADQTNVSQYSNGCVFNTDAYIEYIFLTMKIFISEIIYVWIGMLF
jgi:hypothetical protein